MTCAPIVAAAIASRCSGVRVVATDAATGALSGALSAFGWDAAPPVVEAPVCSSGFGYHVENSIIEVAFSGLEPLVNAAEVLAESVASVASSCRRISPTIPRFVSIVARIAFTSPRSTSTRFSR